MAAGQPHAAPASSKGLRQALQLPGEPAQLLQPVAQSRQRSPSWKDPERQVQTPSSRASEFEQSVHRVYEVHRKQPVLQTAHAPLLSKYPATQDRHADTPEQAVQWAEQAEQVLPARKVAAWQTHRLPAELTVSAKERAQAVQMLEVEQAAHPVGQAVHSGPAVKVLAGQMQASPPNSIVKPARQARQTLADKHCMQPLGQVRHCVVSTVKRYSPAAHVQSDPVCENPVRQLWHT